MNTKFLIPLLFSFLLLLPLAAAEKGVGIMWATQSEMVKEGQINCVEYKVYNPFDENTNIFLTASGNLAPLVKDSDAVLVPAGTTHDKAIPISLCFDIPKVYSKDCTAGVICEQTCSEAEVSYTGEILAAEKSTAGTGAEAAGSATRAVASAPLTLKVACEKSGKNWMPVIAVIIVLALIAAFIALRKKK